MKGGDYHVDKDTDNIAAIKELKNSVKIVGILDQYGSLIIGEDEAWPEAMERKRKTDELLSRRTRLQEFLHVI